MEFIRLFLTYFSHKETEQSTCEKQSWKTLTIKHVFRFPRMAKLSGLLLYMVPIETRTQKEDSINIVCAIRLKYTTAPDEKG